MLCGHVTASPEVLLSGMRRVEGHHVELITDVPSDPEVDSLPRVFDLAVRQMCDYFGVAPRRLNGWRVTAYLMAQPDRFRRQGMWHADLPEFRFGFHRGNEVWVYNQPSAYYRRHLVIHEGVHAFMYRFLGSAGPAWYREGVADLLATHTWADGSLQINRIPEDKRMVPDWGRIKVIREAVEADQRYTVNRVMELASRRFLEVDAYAWSWALCAFLDGHPEWSPVFRELGRHTQRPASEFNGRLLRALGSTQRPMDEAWQLFLHELDYGYRVAEDVIWYDPCPRDSEDPNQLLLQASRGWQSTGIRLSAGTSYRIAASGRFALNGQQPPWMCEAGGVTIEYREGRPLGILLMAIRGENAAGLTPLVSPAPVGLERIVRVDRAGVLFLRINEPAGQRGDNVGRLLVTVEPAG